MSVRDAITERRSIRRYLSRPVEDEKLDLILDSARLAPSGQNSQPCEFIVIDDPAQKRAVYEVAGKYDYFLDVPLLIALIGDLKSRVKNPAADLDFMDPGYPNERHRIIRDLAIAGDHLVLQAQALGLGTCWVGNFVQDELRAVLRVPASYYVLAVIAVGYPNEKPVPRPRKPLAAVLHHNYFQTPEEK